MKQIMPSSSTNVERFTPSWIFETIGERFDLDPCAPIEDCPSKEWCKQYFCCEGLQRPWVGHVWLNPPWKRGAKYKWVRKLWLHEDGIALVRGGVDSKWLHHHPPQGLFLFNRRIQYVLPKGSDRRRKGNALGGFEPSMLLCYGEVCLGWVAQSVNYLGGSLWLRGEQR